MPAQASPHRSIKILLAFLLLLALAIGATGYYYLERQLVDARRAARQELSAIIVMKAAEIESWLQERRGDVQVVLQNPAVQASARRILTGDGDPRDQRELRAWLAGLQGHQGYEQVVLYDAQGSPRLGAPWPPATPDRQGLEAALQDQGTSFTDLHLVPNLDPERPQAIRMAFWVPVAAGPEGQGPPLGALQLLINPERFLFPLIRSWPTPAPAPSWCWRGARARRWWCSTRRATARARP
ncbi:MAG: hypothetical protein V1806_07805 [Pseudomonadota bacterium]